MSDKTSIEWTDATWNPVTGCQKVSEGCRNCYALTFAERFRGTPGHYFEHGFDVTLRPTKLELPFTWKKPRRVFVNSMSDLFHKDVPDEYIAKVFDVMAQTPEHTYQVLTKRPQRMKEFIEQYNPENLAPEILPNVWLGVSVENQQAAEERIPLLLETPAVVRFLSCEPLLGPVDLSFVNQVDHPNNEGYGIQAIEGINWIIAGGESGPKARPMHPEWVRMLRDQCIEAGVSFFFKQWGEWLPNAQEYDANPGDFDYEKKHVMVEDVAMCRAGKKKAGRKIDGRTWDELPVMGGDASGA